jgi:hypothetical protein
MEERRSWSDRPGWVRPKRDSSMSWTTISVSVSDGDGDRGEGEDGTWPWSSSSKMTERALIFCDDGCGGGWKAGACGCALPRKYGRTDAGSRVGKVYKRMAAIAKKRIAHQHEAPICFSRQSTNLMNAQQLQTGRIPH